MENSWVFQWTKDPNILWAVIIIIVVVTIIRILVNHKEVQVISLDDLKNPKEIGGHRKGLSLKNNHRLSYGDVFTSSNYMTVESISISPKLDDKEFQIFFSRHAFVYIRNALATNNYQLACDLSELFHNFPVYWCKDLENKNRFYSTLKAIETKYQDDMNFSLTTFIIE